MYRSDIFIRDLVYICEMYVVCSLSDFYVVDCVVKELQT